MSPRKRSELYRLAVGLFAVAIFLATLRASAWPPPDWWVMLAIVAAGILALQFPLHISVSVKISVATAVFFACALLMPALAAAAVVAATCMIDTVVSVVRRVAVKRERPPFAVVSLSLLFNGGQAYLSVLIAGAVLSAARVSAHDDLNPADAGAVVGAALAMYVTNMFLVVIAEALLTGRNPIDGFLHKQRVVLGQFANLYLVGAALAFAAAAFPWLVAVSLVAAFLVYLSLQHRISLSHESIRAMERMADEVDRRDPYTYHHSQRVAAYSKAIARKLGLSSAEIELIELAAKVHDVGKIRLPDSILLKPGALTAAERRQMETHPRLGFDILRPFSEYGRVLDLVLAHHERYDGRGYPNGSVGRRLLLIAQVIPVADSLDAMTSNRAYRAARSWESAIEELRRGAGTQWNPEVVGAAVAALGEVRSEGALQPALA